MNAHSAKDATHKFYATLGGREMLLDDVEVDYAPPRAGQIQFFASAVLKAKVAGQCVKEKNIQVRIERDGKITPVSEATIFDVEQNACGETVLQFTGRVDARAWSSEALGSARTVHENRNKIAPSTPADDESASHHPGKSSRAGDACLPSGGMIATKRLDTHDRHRTIDRVLREKIEDILGRINRLPMYGSELLGLLTNEAVSPNEMTELIKSDPSLVGMIMRLVNSAYYSLKCKVTDVHHAMLLLGYNQICQIVLAEAVRSRMPDRPEFRELQRHSLIVSTIAYELSLCCQTTPVLLSTIGLLHDIGRSVLLLLLEKNPRLRGFIERLDHAKIGSLLLGKWNVPKIVFDTVQYHRHPEFSPPEAIPIECRNNVAVLYVAHLAYERLHGNKTEELPKEYLGQYLEQLNLAERSIEVLLRSRILPSLHKRMGTFPEVVRTFIERSGRSLFA